MKKKMLTPSTRDAHPYARSKTPWILSEYTICGKLIHYLSAGGMRTFGRTVYQEIARRRQRRFLFIASVLGIVWLSLLIF